MSVYHDKKRGRYCFEFDRVVQGRRIRATKLLPKGWTQAQGDKFDREESSRLYAIAQGIEQAIPKIDTAVLFYLKEKEGTKSHPHAESHLKSCQEFYKGKRLNQLPEVAESMVCAWKRAPATVKQRIALLRAACRYYWKKKRLSIPDPGSHVMTPEVRNERQEYLTRKDAVRLARACERRPVRALILIAFYSGMRKGEIWRATIRNGDFILPDTKNGEPRHVPVVRKIARYAKKHLPPKVSYRSMMIWFRHAATAIGHEGLHFHDLRHSTASAMIKSGKSLYTVGKVLGHKSGRSTLRYAHLANEDMRSALESIE